jgi:diadenosine tetraphosphate (Ap4A) HIT family hydrolase
MGGETCELCETPGGALLWEGSGCRVVRVADPYYPGFCRVIWNEHVREMTDLAPDLRTQLMAVVFAVERTVRDLYAPDKINLASFGNMTPHLHWHVIPRWRDDRHFPEPVWGSVRSEAAPVRPAISDANLRAALTRALAATLPGVPSHA